LSRIWEMKRARISVGKVERMEVEAADGVEA
jgi:hypothetical protein